MGFFGSSARTGSAVFDFLAKMLEDSVRWRKEEETEGTDLKVWRAVERGIFSIIK